MGQGEFFALSQEQVRPLLTEGDSDALFESIQVIEETWDDSHRLPLGKEWNLIQCCVSDGTCNPKSGTYPLNQCILGGRHLLPPNDGYMAVLVQSEEVVEVAAALAELDCQWLRMRYTTLFGAEYDGAVSEQQLNELGNLFEGIKAFYQKAAEERLALLITSDETIDAIYKA
jgi:hypothetical protein